MTDEKRPGSSRGHLTPVAGSLPAVVTDGEHHERPSASSRTIRFPVRELGKLDIPEGVPAERATAYLAAVMPDGEISQASINRLNREAIADLLDGQYRMSGQSRFTTDSMLMLNQNQVNLARRFEEHEATILVAMGEVGHNQVEQGSLSSQHHARLAKAESNLAIERAQAAQRKAEYDASLSRERTARLSEKAADEARHAELVQKDNEKAAAIALLQTDVGEERKRVKGRTAALLMATLTLIVAMVQHFYFPVQPTTPYPGAVDTSR